MRLRLRVRQVQTLVWLGNVLVLAGAAWAAGDLMRTRRTLSDVERPEWPATGGSDFERPRWPGELGTVADIWQTPLDGEVPKPKPEWDEKTEKTPAEEFRARLRISGGTLGSTASTIITFLFDGKSVPLRRGEGIEFADRTWQFTSFTMDDAAGTATAEFVTRDFRVSVTQAPQTIGNLTAEAERRFKVVYLPRGPFHPDVVGREKMRRPAFPEDRPERRWHVTSDELLWWETFGESEVLANLTAKPETDASGASRGVRLVKVPAPAAFDGRGRGLQDGDVLRSINGVAMASLADVVGYLRGDGRCAPEYVVVVERLGAELTVTYDLAEPREARRAATRPQAP